MREAMTTGSRWIADLATLIARSVPPSVLASVVESQGLVGNYQELMKTGRGQAADQDRMVASRIVETYASTGRVVELALALIRRDPGNARFAQGVAELLMSGAPVPTPPGAGVNQQAALAKRAQMLRMPELRQFMNDIEGRVCIVAAELKSDGERRVTTGTGFLVGPDLVLTARHVLRDHIRDGRINPSQTGRRCVFFDHLEGDPIDDPLVDPLPVGVRRVEFDSSNWLEAVSDELPRDGQFDPGSATEIADALKKLDYVLVRLAQPVGSQSRRPTGGARRGWVELWPPAGRPELLASDDRIIIPQHPNGHTQRIDFGRFVKADPSETRIRYDTETDQGTSGAPCFDQNFHLVGIHNAYYDVAPNRRLNQAIRFDRIRSCLTPPAAMAALPGASRVWSVSEDGSRPEVVLGRGGFLDWIELAGRNGPATAAHRSYVVLGPPRSGKSFSARILQASRRDHADRVVVLGHQGVRVPKDPVDFLRVLANQLRIDGTELALLPQRPSDELPEGGDGDKLSIWRAKDLPQWFASAMASSRVHRVDVRDEALQVVKILKDRGLSPAPDDLRRAALPHPQWEQRSHWERIWIVLDDVADEAELGEVKDLIAGLLGVGMDDSPLSDELGRLRWIFLGWRPSFLDGLVAPEILDPAKVGDLEIESCVRALVDSLARTIGADVEFALEYVRTVSTIESIRSGLANPATRLAWLQSIIGSLHGSAFAGGGAGHG